MYQYKTTVCWNIEQIINSYVCKRKWKNNQLRSFISCQNRLRKTKLTGIVSERIITKWRKSNRVGKGNFAPKLVLEYFGKLSTSQFDRLSTPHFDKLSAPPHPVIQHRPWDSQFIRLLLCSRHFPIDQTN